MPTYIERHPTTDRPMQVIQRLRAAADRPTADEPRASVLGWYVDKHATLYCLLYADAPGVVQAHHAAVGLACGDIVELSPERLERERPSSDLPGVPEAITRFWPQG